LIAMEHLWDQMVTLQMTSRDAKWSVSSRHICYQFAE